MFNLAIDSKLRGCDLVQLRVNDVACGGEVLTRNSVVQQKTREPVRFELTDWYRGAPLKQALEARQRQQPALIQYAIYGPCNISDAGLADHMRNRH